jgi:glycosyltransferase involved in cell wall biosynthesis
MVVTKRKYRILFISHRADLTGAPKGVRILVQRINRDLFISEVAVPERGPMLAMLPDEVTVHVLPRGGLAHVGFRTVKGLGVLGFVRFLIVQVRYMWTLYWLIRRRGINIVHLNTAEEPFAALAVWLARKPFIWNIRETFPDTSWARWYAKFVLQLPNRVVLVSCNTRDTLVALAGDGAAKCEVIYNGVEPTSFVPKRERDSVRAEWGISPATTVIMLLGSVIWHKGQLILLQALRQSVVQMPDLEFAAVFAGNVGESEYAQQFMSLAREQTIEPIVRILGQRADVPDILNAADIVVAPSMVDSFPWAVLEAMLMAKPVIASDVCGIGEMVVHGQTGLLIPPGHPESLTEALSLLIRDADMRRQMGARGRDRVLELFTENRYARSYEQLYLDCLDSVAR